METNAATRKLQAAQLLAELADVSAEGVRLEALRSEAAAFAPLEAAVDLALDLLAPTTDPEGLDDSLATLDALSRRLARARAVEPALRLLEGLARLEAAENDRDSPRALRLRAALADACAAAQGGAS